MPSMRTHWVLRDAVLLRACNAAPLLARPEGFLFLHKAYTSLAGAAIAAQRGQAWATRPPCTRAQPRGVDPSEAAVQQSLQEPKADQQHPRGEVDPAHVRQHATDPSEDGLDGAVSHLSERIVRRDADPTENHCDQNEEGVGVDQQVEHDRKFALLLTKSRAMPADRPLLLDPSHRYGVDRLIDLECSGRGVRWPTTAESWIIGACGYVHEGPEPPSKCPACLIEKNEFEVDAANY